MKDRKGGSRYLVNSSGNPVARAGASGGGGGGGRARSPAKGITKRASLRKRLPIPMVMRLGTQTMNSQCRECRELSQARLDEPVLLREDRHAAGVFADVGSRGEQAQEQEQQGSSGGGRRRGFPWRMRERSKTKTFHVGLIACLNIGEEKTRKRSLLIVVRASCEVVTIDDCESPGTFTYREGAGVMRVLDFRYAIPTQSKPKIFTVRVPDIVQSSSKACPPKWD